MTINGIQCDDPDPRIFTKREVRVYNEGKRTRITEIWLDSYLRRILDGHIAVEYSAHKLTMSNYGSILFDDRPVKNEGEIKAIKDLFSQISV